MELHLSFKKKLILIYFLFQILISYSQVKVTHNWVFGSNSALNFNSGAPLSYTVPFYSYEACSSISDTSGNLLFYTNGNIVLNKNGIVMPNGTGLKGSYGNGQSNVWSTSSAQGALIIKIPRKDSLYLIFTSSDIQGGYYYSLVDLRLSNGLGSVTTKNVLLNLPGTEKLCAINHANDTDVWVMTHALNSKNFLAYKVDSSGVNTSPIISQGDTTFTVNIGIVGPMKFSASGKKLAVANWPQSVSLYDFDSATGLVSNAKKWPLPNAANDYVYGLEFSPNDSLLYISSSPGGNLYQYQIFSNNLNTIIQSAYSYNLPYIFQSGGQLQMASDGKIYGVNYNKYVVSVINAPNFIGPLSSYCDSCLKTFPGKSNAALPNFNQSYFKNVPVNYPLTTSLAENSKDNVTCVYPNPATSFIYIRTNFSSQYTIEIFDVNGISVLKHVLPTNGRIDVGNIKPGLYNVVGYGLEKNFSEKLLILR